MIVQQQIDTHLQQWENFIRYFKETTHKAGEAKAYYRHQKQKFIITQREKHGLTLTAAEATAEADPTLYQLHLKHIELEAEVEASKAMLHWYRSKADVLRSEKVDEREQARLHTQNSI